MADWVSGTHRKRRGRGTEPRHGARERAINGNANDDVSCCCDCVRLTMGEVKSVLAIAPGVSSKEAAKKKGLSRRTIDHHIENALAKTGLKNRAELLMVCAAHRIIYMDDDGIPQWSGRYCLPPHIRPKGLFGLGRIGHRKHSGEPDTFAEAS